MSQFPQVLIIGLDGATLDLIEPWAKSGLLPNLQRIMDAGMYSRLKSIQPVISAPAWATFMTGVNPARHGMFDFAHREPDGYQLKPTSFLDIHQPPFWEILGRQGCKVGIINVPMTYPPQPVNGYLVSGLGTPETRPFTYPHTLAAELREMGYRVNRKVYECEGNEEAYLQDAYEMMEQVTQAALHLMATQPSALTVVVYRNTDEITHMFWHHMDATHPKHVMNSPYKDVILNVYQQLDEYIGQLVAFVGPEANIIIMSDHGFGPLLKDVYLNKWLHDQGYLSYRTPALHKRVLGRMGLTRNNISRFLRKQGFAWVEQWIKDVLGDKVAILPKETWSDFEEGIDWGKTKAYSYGFQGQVNINLAGREPMGTVPVSEYLSVREEIMTKLMSLVDPEDGKPVVDKIYTREELFEGPYIDRAPDLVLDMRNLSYITRIGYEFRGGQGEYFGPTILKDTGGHRQDGLLMMSGPAIAQKSQEYTPAPWIGDIAPMVLHMMGIAVPEWMDGKVLTQVFSVDLMEQPVKTLTAEEWYSQQNSDAPLSQKEEEELMKRLKDLGYLG